MDLAALLLTGGGVGATLAFTLALVRIAIGTERRRADDWKEAAQTSAVANTVLTGNMERLITTVEHLATAQRETLTLVQVMAAREPRSVA